MRGFGASVIVSVLTRKWEREEKGRGACALLEALVPTNAGSNVCRELVQLPSADLDWRRIWAMLPACRDPPAPKMGLSGSPPRGSRRLRFSIMWNDGVSA